MKCKNSSRKCRTGKESVFVCIHGDSVLLGTTESCQSYKNLKNWYSSLNVLIRELSFLIFCVFLACHRKKNHKIIWNCSVFLNGSFVIRNFILYLHVFDFMFAVSLLIFKTTEKNNLCCQYLCALCRWFLLVHPSHLSSFTESLPHSIPQFSDSHKHPSSLSLAGTGSEEEEQVTSAKCLRAKQLRVVII